MGELTTILYNLFVQMNIFQYFAVLFNQYFPYGLFYWMLGFVIMIVVHIKTKNLAFSSVIMAFYFVAIGYTGIVINAYSRMAMQYAGFIIGAIVGIYLYRVLRG